MQVTSANLDETLSTIFDNHGVFFAFSKEQYEARAKENTEYVACSGGLLCPRENVKDMLAEMNDAVDQHHKVDLATNGKKKIIWRELANYESQISMDICEAVDALGAYGISEEEVRAEWKAYYRHCIENDYF